VLSIFLPFADSFIVVSVEDKEFLMPAAYIIYLIIVGVMLFLAVPAALIFYARYWNGSKFLKAQMAKSPIDTFGGTVSKWREYTFKEDDDRYFQKLQGKIFDLMFSAKGMVFVTLISSLLIILIPMIVIMASEGTASWIFWVVGILLFPIPVVMFYRASYKRYRNIEAEREGQIKRMFDVANSALKFDPMAAFMPSSVVNVTKWKDKTVPQSVVILYPTTFRADSQGSRESFESAFNNAITEDNAWIYTWHPTKNAIQCRPVEDLPKYVEYKGAGPFEWHTFPLGVGLGPKGQEIISYSVNKNKTGLYYPHVLVAGTTGSGKSVIQRNIIFHCIQHNDMWRFLGVDLKRVELSRFKRYTKTVLGIATDLEQGVEVVKYAHDVMMERYAKMEAAGVNIFLDMVDENGKPEYAILLMIDEAFMFMSPEGNKSEEGKRNDMLHAEASHVIGNIARLGRAAGVHLVLATQRPDATVIKGELKNNLDVRIAAGRLDSTPSLMVLDSGAATMLPPIKGRGIARIGAEPKMFQGFFAEQDWIDNWLAKPQNRWREPDLFKDKAVGKTVSPLDALDVDGDEDFIDIEMEDMDDDLNVDDLLDELDTENATHPLPPVPSSSVGLLPTPTIVEDVEQSVVPFEQDELFKETTEPSPATSSIQYVDPDEREAELDRNFMFDDEIDDIGDSNITESEIEQLLLELARLDEEEGETYNDEPLDMIEDFDDEEVVEVNPQLKSESFIEDEEVDANAKVEDEKPAIINKIGNLIISAEDEPLSINKKVLDNASPVAPANTPAKPSVPSTKPSSGNNAGIPIPNKAKLPERPTAPKSPSEIIKQRPVVNEKKDI
jgi:hypothetical protein